MEVAEILSMKYPFGREHEASVQLLFRSFCNNLFIGQFESARASIQELHTQSSFLRTPVKDILQRALNTWCKSETPLHPLSWPCFVEYQGIHDNHIQVSALKKTLEFKLILAKLCGDCEPSHLEELYGIFTGTGSDGISPQCESYLTSLLVEEPALTIQLFNFLPTERIIYQCNNIMIDALQLSFTNQAKEPLCCLLSCVNIDLHTDGTKDRVENLLKDITSSCKSSGWISIDEVNRALSCRENTELYNLAQTAVKEVQCEDSQANLYSKWMRIALDTVGNQNHFFDVIMSRANTLMKAHKYAELVTLLNTPEWRPLLPAIFHLAWRQCTNTEESHQLITAFSGIKDPKLKALLDQHQRIDLIEQSLNLSSDKGKRWEVSSGMLSVGYSHSVLHALLMCLDDLHLWSHQKMMQTLSAKSAYALLRQSENEVIADGDPSLSIEQQCDINLFNSFHIINNTMQAIHTSSNESSHLTLSQRYKETVVPLLNNIKQHLNDLRPLTLRLEVMEDIFTLLFSLGSDFDGTPVETPTPSIWRLDTPQLSVERETQSDEEYYSAREAVSPLKSQRNKQTDHPSNLVKQAVIRKLDSNKNPELSDRSSDEKVLGESLPMAVGFLSNEFIVRDLLSILKEGLTDITAARYECTNNQKIKRLEGELTTITHTTVSETDFMSRSSQLQQRVSEAVWRYQLILQDSITKEFGSTVTKAIGHDDNLYDDGYASFERSLHQSPTKRLMSSSGGQMRSAEGSQDTELSSEVLTYSSGATVGAQLTKKSKRYKKRKGQTGPNNSAIASCNKLSLVGRMLSAPVSLLNMCIKRQSFVQASQVMTLFNLESSDAGKAFNFSQSYKTFLRLTLDQSTMSPSRSMANTMGGDLSFIHRAAEKSLSTMSGSAQAEDLAGRAPIPSSVNVTENQIVKFIGSGQTSATASVMVLLDLVCVASDDPQLCQQFLNSAQKMISSTAARKSAASGLQSFLRRCLAINDEALSTNQSKIKQMLTLADDNLSIRSCLLSDVLCLDINEVQSKMTPLVKMNEEVMQIDRAYTAWQKSGQGERLVASSPIKSLIQSLRDSYPESRQYLSDLFDQINLLHKLKLDNTEYTSGSFGTISSFSALEDGPAMIMGQLMFNNNVEPTKLESVASQVKLDLTHVIVRSCCLPVRCKPIQQPAVLPSVHRLNAYGYRLLLNGGLEEEPIDFTLSPLDIVQSCLIMLLSVVKDSLSSIDSKILSKENVEVVRSASQYGSFCKECERLQEVDLQRLVTDSEKRAFFINLHNLISLHGVIEHLSSSSSKQAAENSISNLLAFHLRFSYSVGELGICSIFELEQFLLKVSNKVQQLDLSMEHPWFCYAPEYNPLTVFLLYDGSMNVLPLKCVTVDSVESDISSAVDNYMKQAVIVTPRDFLIEIPELLIRTRADLKIESQGQTIPMYDNADVLMWIQEYQPATRWSEIKVIMDKLEHQNDQDSVTTKSDDEQSSLGSEIPATVEVIPANHRPGMVLDTRAASLLLEGGYADEREASTELSSSYRLTRSDTILHQAQFKISDVAIQYLREKSPVVAMLLDIIDEDVLLHNDDDGNQRFNSETLKREYVNLYRYLEQCILPLCVPMCEDIKTVDQMSTLDLPSHMKSAILTHKSSLLLEFTATRCLDILCLAEKYDTVVILVDNLMGMVFNPPQDWLALKDFALIQCAAESVSSESLACIKQLYCDRLESHIAISCLHKSRWAVDKCLQILPQCERRLVDRGDKTLVPHLQLIIERMSAFHRIMLHAQAKQDLDIQGCPDRVVQALASGWQSVSETLTEEPSAVYHLLFDAKEYLFAKKLVDMNSNTDQELRMLVYVRYAVSNLDQSADTSDLVKLLTASSNSDTDWTFLLSLELLRELSNPHTMLAVVQFVMAEMMTLLDELQQKSVELCYTGIQMLMKLEKKSHTQYKSLIFSPLLMVEQLLMNAKISWAGRVLPVLYQHEEMFSGSDDLKFREKVNELLVKYAEKAVDFPVLYVTADNTDGISGSVSPRLRSVRTLATVGSPITASPLQKALLGSSLRKSSLTSISRLNRTTTAPGNLSALAKDDSSAGAVAGASGGAASGGVTLSSSVTARGVAGSPSTRGIAGSPSITVSPASKKKFVLPERAPAKENWVPDEKAEKCMLCRVESFSMFNRRHHCRRCGRVVCAGCSSRTAPVGGRSVRVCDECYENMFTSREILEQQDPSVRKLREKLSGAASPPNTTSHTPTYQITLSQINTDSMEWCLSTEAEENEEIRNEFFYDHAPSVSLCTDILKLFDDSIQCGKHMLSLCEKLSHIIKPIRPETINQEVDYNLVISMMKFLLLNAKLLFMREHYADGVSLCETYSNIVEVLSLLLSDYYLDLPTVEELSKIDNIRRLRDRLMEDERPELAMEISTKFGLETPAIWTYWGLTCIRKADYMGARDKFSKFMKPPMDKNSPTVAYSSVLNDIVSTIEGLTAQTTGTYTQISIQATLSALTANHHDLSKTVPLLEWDAAQHDENQHHVQECMYYLKLYGNHQLLIQFYRLHGFWDKAVQYCLDKKCSAEIFVSCLFNPAVRDGDLQCLQDKLILSDPTLQKWNSYLTAVCRTLARSSQYHLLYQIQLFTKDFIRAAMTCVQMFYLDKAKTYVELSERIVYLDKALDHYQSYLNPTKWDKIPRPKPVQQGRSIESSARLAMAESDVKRNIGTVTLQREVTKFLASTTSRREPAHTLFGDTTQRTTLASKLILAGKNMNDGFNIAFRIIQEYQLAYSTVYTLVAETLGDCRFYSHIKQLLICIKDSGLSDPELQDKVLLTAIKSAGPSESSQSKDIEALTKLLRAESSKVEAYIMSGKLRNAYLLAIKSDSLPTIIRIAEEAERLNQTAVKNICEKYIKQKRSQ